MLNINYMPGTALAPGLQDKDPLPHGVYLPVYILALK